MASLWMLTSETLLLPSAMHELPADASCAIMALKSVPESIITGQPSELPNGTGGI